MPDRNLARILEKQREAAMERLEQQAPELINDFVIPEGMFWNGDSGEQKDAFVRAVDCYLEKETFRICHEDGRADATVEDVFAAYKKLVERIKERY